MVMICRWAVSCILAFALLLAPGWVAAPEPACGSEGTRDAVLRQLAASRTLYTTSGAWATRRTALREGFLAGAGLWPLPEKTPLNPIRHSLREHDGYTVENIALETMPGFFFTGNLYRPANRTRKSPAVLSPHGHFRPEGRFRAEQQIRCAHLARMGATVFSCGMVGWQDSTQTTHDDPLVLALQTWNSIRVVDFLAGLDGVDGERIAVSGASGGATQTLYLTLIDNRIKVSAPVVVVYPWGAPEGCVCEGGMRVMQDTQTNAVEIAAAAAPRPQLIISAGKDATGDFPQTGFPFIRHVYELHGKPDAVVNVHLKDEGHDYGRSKRKALYDFLVRHLGLTARDEKPETITIESPADLSVFDGAHPLPAHAVRGSEAVAAAFRALPRPARTAPADPHAAKVEAFLFTPSGFPAPGRPRTVTGPQAAKLELTVRDQRTGKPTPCRINVVGPDGNFYQPPADDLSPFALTGDWPKVGRANRSGKGPFRYWGHFFYSRGNTTVEVPAGKVRIEIWKGIEFSPQTQTLDAIAGTTHKAEFTLAPAVALSDLGYYSGDPHLHLPRRSETDDELILDLLEAEDVRFGSILAYNEPAGPYLGVMDRMDNPQERGTGERSIRRRGPYQIISGQEYRSGTYGHLNLYGLGELVLANQQVNANNWPIFGEVGRGAQAAGGFAITAHGGYSQAIYADFVQGNVNAIELLQFGIYRGIALEDWYRILNIGYRFPCVGASDYPACRKFGDCLTYIHRAETPAFSDWYSAAAEGHSFVTTGPLLLLEVDGKKPGEIVRDDSQSRMNVTARIRVRSEVAPVTHVQLVARGQVVREWQIPQDQQQHRWVELQQMVPVDRSSWIAARAYSRSTLKEPDAEAHTNPVYVHLQGRASYDRKSLDALIQKIDGQLKIHEGRQFAERDQVVEYFRRSRAMLQWIHKSGGLKADEGPREIAAALRTEAAKAATEFDPSARTHTDEELREFLKPVPPKPAAEAAKLFETAGGFQMQLVAAEPQVHSPVAAAFDEDGRLYVCELRDYPYHPRPGQKPLGAVRRLEDVDGDGVFDRSTVFADGLLWSAAIAPWKGGVFIAAPPDIWYMRDDDGDGVADTRERVFTGFGEKNPQAILNNFTYGLDHKIYAATAGNGGNVRRGDGGDAPPLRVDGRDFRFDPVTLRFETISGNVQFGNTFDDWGNRFRCSESNPLVHVVLPEHYLVRNPDLAAPATVHNIAPGPVPIYRISPVERWRMIRSARRIAHSERAATSAGASHNVIDAAAGVTIYRGGAYLPEYYGSVFVGDGQNNLIHRRVLIPDQATFKSRRGEVQSEIVRTPDIWFRPVNFVNAPDGTLYVLDLSREVLEAIHIPLDVLKFIDLTSGRNTGRIYRLAPPGFHVPPAPRLSQASGGELVAALESPHGWWRDTAHRLIFERQDRSLAAPLRQLLRKGARPQSRIHALWSLRGLGTLADDDLTAALADTDPHVREQGLKLADARLKESPAILASALALENDPDYRVRMQLAFTLGESDSPRAASALARMLRQSADDRWMRTALLSSIPGSAHHIFAALAGDDQFTATPAGGRLLDQLALIVGARHHDDELRTVLSVLTGELGEKPALQRRWLASLGEGLQRSGRRLPLDRAGADPADQLIRTHFDAAAAALTTESNDESVRRDAARFLSYFPEDETRAVLVRTALEGRPAGVQISAVEALGVFADPEIGQTLVGAWRNYSPSVRMQVLQTLLSRERWTRVLLEAADAGEVTLAEVDPTRRKLLREHRDKGIAALAQKLFSAVESGSRQKVLDEYSVVLTLTGKPEEGHAVFQKTCATCHRIGTEGYAVGPDLSTLAAQDPAAMLAHILDPNRYVLPNHVEYIVEDRSGRTETGLLASETATSVTLRRGNGEEKTLLRSEVESIQSTGRSLMPEGLEKTIPPQAMADLLAWLRTIQPAPRLDIGNRLGRSRRADPVNVHGLGKGDRHEFPGNGSVVRIGRIGYHLKNRGKIEPVPGP
jgi:putative membrane-bound dehydrogenase-like protein